MVRRGRYRGGLHRGSDELRRQCRAARTDHVANGYSFTDTCVNDATWSDELCRAAGTNWYSFTDTGLDDATRRAGDSYSFTDAGVDDATSRAGDSYCFTDTGLNDAALTIATVNSVISCR
jgi:hypothetical protein